MRLALKITFVVTLWSVTVLAGHATVRLDRELALIDANARRDEFLIGRALRPAIEAGWETGGAAAVNELLTQANASEDVVRLRVVEPPSGALGFTPARLGDAALWASLARGQEVVRAWPAEQNPERLYTYVPLRLRPSAAAALELMATLEHRDAFIRRSREELLINIVLLGGCSALVAVVLGFWFVGRRVEQLVAMAREVGRGEFGRSVPVRGWDELSDLAQEMNGMAQLLDASRARAREEAAKRQRTSQLLRHADRLATVGALVARVAHELGTPLNVILARAKLIARGRVQGETVQKNATIVVEQAEHITKAVRRMLDFSRRGESARAALEASRLLHDTHNLVRPFAEERQVAVELGEPASSLVVRVDPIQIAQALVNLVVNAVLATPPGGRVWLAAEATEATPPPERGLARGRFLCVSVRDHGEGVAPELLRRIFEPFYTARAEGAGTGLGLTIAEEIVHENEGWIEVSSEPGSGCEFRVFLPLADA